MAVVRKKQDDKNLKILREIVSLSGNKQCFDCNQKGPTYVNMTIGSFVCTRCSGMLRGLTPPHRVKSISMATFSTDEIDFIKAHGNELCAKTWLGLWDPKRVHTQDQRELMIDKYERKRYYLEPASPLKSITNTAQLAPSQKQQQTQLNSATLLTNGTAKSIEENSSNLWASNATMNGKASNNRWKMDLLSSNDNSSLFNNHISAPAATNGIRSNGSIANNNSNGHLTNGFSLNGNKSKDVITKNGFIHLPPPGSNVENSNLFTPDADFVVDFSSANIFDALNNKPSINKSGTTNKATLLQGPPNGNHSNGVELTNGTNGFAATDVNKTFDENFADFEHNTIYNAAAIENQNSNYFNSFSYNNNSTNLNNGNANTQWSVWQQFPWPYIQPEQNRWSLPMSLSSTSNSLKSSGTFNSNSSINSTPSVDRYAALKDLDDQLREIKEKDNHNTLTAAPANPFNVLSTSPSAQPNPFQTTSSPPWFNEQSILTPASQPMYPITNGNGNGNVNGNGLYDQSAFGMNGFNGNGPHYQKVTDSNLFNGSLNMTNGFPQKNPFAAPVLNATTNPFL